MHKAPTDGEKYAYLNTDRFYFYLLGSVSLVFLMGGMALFVASHSIFYFFIPLYGSILFYLCLSYLLGIFARDFNLAEHDKISQYDIKSSVDIFLPICGESWPVILNTWLHVYEMAKESKYPIRVYVLDDGDYQPLKKTTAEGLDFTYLSRPNRGEHKKAGNLRYGFERSDGDLITIFDADFCPRKDFLTETVPYFSDPKIGIVQTPQFFQPSECVNWIDRGSAIIQILFYKLIQMNRDNYAASICVGTNAVYRRSMLAPFGGTALIGYSEDLHTGFNCYRGGFVLRYLPLNLAKGLCPDKMAQYFNQQYRWCMGSFTLFTSKEFWTTKMTTMMRVSYLSGMLYYVITAMGIFTNPLPSLLILYFYPEQIFWFSIFFSIPSLAFGTMYFAYWSGHRAVLDVLRARQFAYYAYLYAIKDKLLGNLMEWVPTGSTSQAHERFRRSKSLLYGWNCLMLMGVFFMSGLHWSVSGWNLMPVMVTTLFWFYVSLTALTETSE